MAQKDDFFFEANSVEGITEVDYQRAMPYVETAQAFAQTTYQSIYIIDYHRKNFLYVSDNPLFLCGHTSEEVRKMGYDFYLSYVPKEEVPMLTELNRSGFRAFYDEPVENRRQCMMSYDFHIAHGNRLLLINDHQWKSVACPMYRVALIPEGSRPYRISTAWHSRQAHLFTHSPSLATGRRHRLAPRGEAGAHPRRPGVHHSRHRRPSLPWHGHRETLPSADFPETRRTEHHRGPGLRHQLRTALTFQNLFYSLFHYTKV